MVADEQAVYRSMAKLRADAKALGFSDAAAAYGWSLIRMGNEMLARGTWPKVRSDGSPFPPSTKTTS